MHSIFPGNGKIYDQHPACLSLTLLSPIGILAPSPVRAKKMWIGIKNCPFREGIQCVVMLYASLVRRQLSGALSQAARSLCDFLLFFVNRPHTVVFIPQLHVVPHDVE